MVVPKKGDSYIGGVSLNMVGGHGGAKTFFLVEDDGIYK